MHSSPRARAALAGGRLGLHPPFLMSLMTDAELAELAREPESAHAERKASLQGDGVKRKVRQALCAFANDLAGSATGPG